MSVNPRTHASLAALALSLTTPSAGAQTSPAARLDYSHDPAPIACATEEAFRSAVSARLGVDPFDPAAQATVAVRWTHRPREDEVTVAVRDAQGNPLGTRVFRGSHRSCREVLVDAAVAVGIALDALVATSPPSPAPPSPPPPPPLTPTIERERPPPVRVETLTPSPPATPPAPRERWRWWVGVSATLYAGLTPDMSVGVAPQVGLRRGRLSLWIEGRVDLEDETLDARGLGGAFQTVLGTLGACAHAWVFAGCATGSAGVLLARGVDNPSARSSQQAIVAVGGRFQGELPLGAHLGLRGHLELQGVVLGGSWAFDAPGARTVWETSSLHVGGGVGLAGRFP